MCSYPLEFNNLHRAQSGRFSKAHVSRGRCRRDPFEASIREATYQACTGNEGTRGPARTKTSTKTLAVPDLEAACRRVRGIRAWPVPAEPGEVFPATASGIPSARNAPLLPTRHSQSHKYHNVAIKHGLTDKDGYRITTAGKWQILMAPPRSARPCHIIRIIGG